MFYTGWKEKDNYFEFVNKNSISSFNLKSVSFWETYFVGLGLGVDDFAQALGLSLAGFPIILTVCLLEASEVIALFSGNFLSLKGFSKKVNRSMRLLLIENANFADFENFGDFLLSFA